MAGAATSRARRQLLASGLAAALFAAGGMPVSAGARSGGRLTVGLGGAGAQDGWDPRGHDGLFMQVAGLGCVYESLVEIGPDGTLRGELATQWRAGAGGRDWRFELREGVRFHDGRTLGAADAVASLDGNPALGAGVRVTAEGALGLRVTLEEGDADFPFRLADPRLAIRPADGATGAGTGLYRLAEFVPGERFLGRRVETHWKDGQAGWLDEVALLALDPAALRLAALRTGRVDAVAGLDAHGRRLLEAGGEVTFCESAADCAALSARVRTPGRIGRAAPLDDLRLAQRWWVA